MCKVGRRGGATSARSCLDTSVRNALNHTYTLEGDFMASEQNELESFTRRRGLWSVSGVPHKGWFCIGVEDLGEPIQLCDMCETSMVRFVHYMKHPNYLCELAVGCICAGNMEADCKAAELREVNMKKRAGKRKRWLTRQWKLSKKGNPFLKCDGYIISVYKMQSGWGCFTENIITKEKSFSRKAYDSIVEAKLAGFDLISKII